jgi:hypothetical protein
MVVYIYCVFQTISIELYKNGAIPRRHAMDQIVFLIHTLIQLAEALISVRMQLILPTDEFCLITLSILKTQ